jgi:hypothetical protein
MKCPHPMYASSEYAVQRYMYLAPGWLGGAASMLLLADSLRHQLSTSSSSKSFKSSPTYKFQTWGAIVVLVYLAVGPLLATTGTVGCDGDALPYLTNGSAPITETIGCSVNRASIFLPMIVLNLLLVNILNVIKMLNNAAKMKGSKGKVESGALKAAATAAIFIPLLDCVAMYAIDSISFKDANFQGEVARWMMQCGPRLGKATEGALVHAPICFVCIALLLASARASLIARRLAAGKKGSDRGSVAPGSPAGAKSSFKAEKPNKTTQALLELAKSLSVLGLMCGALGITYTVTILLIVPSLDQTSTEFVDFFLCKTQEAIVAQLQGGMLKTAKSCEELFTRLGAGDATLGKRLPASQVYFSARPKTELIGLSLMCPAIIPCLFSAFYGKFWFDRFRKAAEDRADASFKSVANTSASTAAASNAEAK